MHAHVTQMLIDESARFAPVIGAMAAVLLRTVQHINSYTGYRKREKANLAPIGLGRRLTAVIKRPTKLFTPDHS